MFAFSIFHTVLALVYFKKQQRKHYGFFANNRYFIL